jgi:hypothetical protein
MLRSSPERKVGYAEVSVNYLTDLLAEYED